MNDLDPFSDAAFVSRLQKLLAMLASEQPGEAEAARRKMLEHLAHHRLGLTDMAKRLAATPVVASYGTSAREASLQREVFLARAARHEAQMDLGRQQAKLSELLLAWQQATEEAAAAQRSRDRIQWLAIGAAGLALICLSVIFLPFIDRAEQDPAAAAQLAPQTPVQTADPVLSAVLALAPGERAGITLVQDLAVRLEPTNDGDVRTYLNQGTHVVIEREIHSGTQTWLMVRSVSGSGWVRSGDVLH